MKNWLGEEKMRLSYLGFVISSLLMASPRPPRLPEIRQERETSWAHQPRRERLPKRKAPPVWKQERRC
jgi:hypothetical protein